MKLMNQEDTVPSFKLLKRTHMRFGIWRSDADVFQGHWQGVWCIAGEDMGEDHYLFLSTLPLFYSNRACHDTESLQKELNYYVLHHCGQKYLVCNSLLSRHRNVGVCIIIVKSMGYVFWWFWGFGYGFWNCISFDDIYAYIKSKAYIFYVDF